PNLPTMTQFLPDYQVTGITGISAPKGTPSDVIGILNKAVNTTLADPKIKARFADLGSAELVGTPADFGQVGQGRQVCPHQAGMTGSPVIILLTTLQVERR